MNFSRSTVLSMLLVCALAVAFSGVAQAQDCIAQVAAANVKMVRAEGITEEVGAVQLRCSGPIAGTEGIGFTPGAVAEKIKVSIQLNTNITNTIDDDRVVMVLADADAATALNYLSGAIHIGANQYTGPRAEGSAIVASAFGDGELSDDGTMITWELETDTGGADPFNLGVGDNGFAMMVSGIRANASMVGDGEDIMANVMVGDSAVNEVPIKAADVAYGIEIPGDELMDVDGVVCNDGDMTASFIIKEGFASGIMAMMDSDTTADVDESMRSDSIMVAVTGVPDGVKVTVPDVNADPMAATAEKSYNDVLRLERRTGRTSGADEDGVLELSHAGAGSVIYDVVARTVDTNDPPTVDTADDTGMSPDNSRADEWATLTVKFEWDGGDVDLGSVMLWVSFNPTSNDTGDSFANGGPKLPRFMEDGMGDTILTIGDCKSTLFYPFVTSRLGYDTGIVVSNTSSVAGTCMATYSGYNAPEDPVDIGEIMPGMQAIFLVGSEQSGHGLMDLSGYLTVNCTTQSASGFAHVVDTMGNAGSQGYIAQEK